MIRVMHVSPVGLTTGGTEQAIHLLCQHSDKSKVLNYLWSPHGGGATLDAMIQESVLAGVTLTQVPTELVDFINRHEIEIAVVHSGSLNLWYARPPFGILTEIPGLPVVEVMHRELPAWGTKFGVHVIVAVSPHVATLQQSVPSTSVVTIPNGIALEEFKPSPELSAINRRRWGIPPQAIVLGFFGRMVEEKGPQDVLEIVRSISEVVPHAWFVFGGEGPLRTRLQERAATLGTSNVLFLGRVEARDRTAFFSALDILLLPSRTEAFPLVLIEAAAMSLPVVAYEIAAVASFFDDYVEKDFLAPVEDIAALGRAAARLCTEPSRRISLGARNRNLAQRYSIRNTASRYETMYAELASKNPARSPATATPGMYRYMSHVAILQGDRPRANALCQEACTGNPGLVQAIQEDIRRFGLFVTQFQNTQSGSGQ